MEKLSKPRPQEKAQLLKEDIHDVLQPAQTKVYDGVILIITTAFLIRFPCWHQQHSVV